MAFRGGRIADVAEFRPRCASVAPPLPIPGERPAFQADSTARGAFALIPSMLPDRSALGSEDPRFANALERARAMAPTVEAEAKASEEAGTLTPKVVETFRDSELLRAFLPRELGGDELPPVALLAIVEEVARQDGSSGWCFGMNGIITGICASRMSEAGLERVYGDEDPTRILMAGGFPPMGRSVREGDGWRVSGDMRFGSGIKHADFVVCTTMEFVDDQPVMDGPMPRMRTFVVPREEVRITDNWQVSGLEGTGSCDYHLDDQLLSDDVSFISSGPDALRGSSLYGLPILSVANAPHAGFALGVGRRALDEIAEHAGWRQRLASRSKLAERGAFQQAFARARTRLEAARNLSYTRFRKLAAARETPAGVTAEERANLSAATTFAYETALEATRDAFRSAGAAAIFRDNRLQRCLRDIETGAQHIVPSDESWERVGQFWLGLDEPPML